jgi:hypothetical protein
MAFIIKLYFAILYFILSYFSCTGFTLRTAKTSTGRTFTQLKLLTPYILSLCNQILNLIRKFIEKATIAKELIAKFPHE